MSERFNLRKAQPADIPALHELIALSVHGLMTAAYSPSQLQFALGTWLGVDSQLVADGTYFVVETEQEGSTVMVACGGWSKRKTPYGSDHRPGREDTLLDPDTDAAKIRAFFVHPELDTEGNRKLDPRRVRGGSSQRRFQQVRDGSHAHWSSSLRETRICWPGIGGTTAV